MTPQAGLFLSSIAFVGTHFLLSHPLRGPLIRRLGTGPFQGLYSLVAFLTLGSMIYFYRVIGREPALWVVGDAIAAAASVLMWFGAILFVGSFARNPAFPGARLERGQTPHGIFAITRHPMMWGFAIWALVHLAVVATPKALVLDGAIVLLALGGSVGQDSKKRQLLGERFHEWSAQTAFWPFARGLHSPGAFALIGGTLLFLAATWLHPLPVGIWRLLA